MMKIDLSKYDGHTSGPLTLRMLKKDDATFGCIENNAGYEIAEVFGRKDTLHADSAMFRDAPEILEYARELEVEVERLRARVAHLKGLTITGYEAVLGERDKAQSLVTELAGTLEPLAKAAIDFAKDMDSNIMRSPSTYERGQKIAQWLCTLEANATVARAALAKVKQEPVTDEEAHILRHKKLHKNLDELVADYITHTKGLPSKNTILDLMRWAHEQIIKEGDTNDRQEN